MKWILFTIITILISGCSTHQYSISELPIVSSSELSAIYIVPNNGADIYHIKDGKEIFLGKTGFSTGDFTFRYIVAKAKPGIYKFKAKKFSDETNITIEKGKTIILTEEPVWDTSSVIGMFGIPALVAITQKQKLVFMEENEGIEKILRFNGREGAKIEVPIVLEP